MAVNSLNLIEPKTVESSQTTQYVATDCITIIDKFTATNVDASNRTVTINIVASGGSPTLANTIVKSREIAPNETYTMPELIGQILNNGDYISAIASASNSIVIRVSGREIT